SYAGAYLVKRGRFLMSELPEVLGPDIARKGVERLNLIQILERAVTPDPGTPYARVAALESSLYLRNQLLRDMDWASMAHSLEVRSPFLSKRVVELAFSIPASLKIRGRTSKAPLRLLATRYLPASHALLPKRGFHAPIDEWFRGELRGPFESDVLGAGDGEIPWIDLSAVRRIWLAHQARATDSGATLWALWALAAWTRTMKAPAS
ncbi:MAG: asparagine synthase-related protein, partial [Candidatus Binatia bacterium]